MILAWHLVWTAYGWWFPNDPRGSWSKEIWKPGLKCLAASFTRRNRRGRKPVQPTPPQLRRWLDTAQKQLKYRPVILDSQARNIARAAITKQAQLNQYELLALTVMPEHVHVVVRAHEHKYERIVRGFKAVSARELRKHLGLAASPATWHKRAVNGAAKREGTAAGAAEDSKRTPVWSHGYWVRYLDTDKALATATSYVKRQNV